MARTVTAAANSVLTSDRVEAIAVLEVFWSGDENGPSEYYADQEISGTPVKAKILSLSPINEAVQVAQGSRSSSFRCTLDDTDGVIKAIFDLNDPHKVPVKVSVFLTGTDFSADRIAIFTGQISSPVDWSAGDLTFDLSVVTRLEDAEIGFSAEEGAFNALPDDLRGKVWPMCFGTTINVPAIKADPSISGTLMQGTGISDFTLPTRIELAKDLSCPRIPTGLRCTTRITGATYTAQCVTELEEDKACAQAKCVELARLELQLEEQTEYEHDTIQILGGEQFPQNRVITLNIGGGKFRGRMNGDTFSITYREHPDYDPETGGVRVTDEQIAIESGCPGTDESTTDTDFLETEWGPVYTGARTSRLSWEAYRDAEKSSFFWAQGGSLVTMVDKQEISYICNVGNSTVKRVSAFRTINGVPYFLTVPEDFYETRTTNYGGQVVKEIVFQRPLSQEQMDTGGGWSDDIYVSQISQIGPNTVDIISFLINKYTDYEIDNVSFTDVKVKVSKYPMDFALTRRPPILSFLEEIAHLARCAIWLKDNRFYIKYLPEEPAPEASITDDDVLVDDNLRSTLRLTLTKTEDLVTKLSATWRRDYALEQPNKFILRHNIRGKFGMKYGTHDREFDYFAFAHASLVNKTATFWLIRWANTWKRLSCSLPLDYINLEPFDAVTVNIAAAASEQVLGIVEKAEVDTAAKRINVEIWLPVRAGEMTAYDFAYPAFIAQHALFPSLKAIANNEAGSGGGPNFSSIAPPGHPLQTTRFGLFTGVSLACNGNPIVSFQSGACRQDWGDRNPSDIGDGTPTLNIPTDTTGQVSTGSSPVTNGAGTGFFSSTNSIEEGIDKNESCCGRAKEHLGGPISDDFFNNPIENPIDRPFLDSLPDPDDLDEDEFPCQIRVTVTGFGTSEQIGTCFPQFPPHTEIYVYDSLQAAQDFCTQMKQTSNCGSHPPCTQCVICLVSGECDPEDEGEGALIGFRASGNFDDTAFILFME